MLDAQQGKQDLGKPSRRLEQRDSFYRIDTFPGANMIASKLYINTQYYSIQNNILLNNDSIE